MAAEKRDTRAVLLETALDLIWTQSYARVSVEDICQKADAKKGSFYHYFESKSDLAKAALDFFWEQCRPSLDDTFSPQRPPLERLKRYAEEALSEQQQFKEKLGYVVGCPMSSIGSEQCSCGDGLSAKSKDILGRFETYLRSAIKDAIEDCSIPPLDPVKAAAQLFTYELGALSLARISNSLEPLKGLYEVWLAMLHPQQGSGTNPNPAALTSKASR